MPEFGLDTAFAISIAKLAGNVLKNTATSPIERKVGTDIVTAADLESESVILRAIELEYPDDEVLAEESGQSGHSASRRWCVDPLDGTVNFANGIPYFGVSLGLEDEIGGAAAVVYDPTRDEVFSTFRGSLTKLNGVELAGRERKAVSDSVIAVQLPEPQWFRNPSIVRMVQSARGLRLTGSTALDLAWTAIGRYDLCLYRRTVHRWDWVAGELLVATSPGSVVQSLGMMGDLELMAAGNEESVRAASREIT